MAPNEQDAKNGELNKFLVVNIAATIILLAVFFGVMYFTMNSMLEQKISKIQITSEELDESGSSEDEIQKGIIVDLGDFILNLCDEAQKKYLKVNVAIEVTQKDTDFPKEIEAPKSGGHGHGAAPAPVDPMEAIQKEMNQFKPAIRDAVITNLSSKTSAELASAAGKELAKEQISNDINNILAGEREVLRVSFGQFIIQ
ncbi:flagellar basal body-associated FliL family protein [bacterium]|jgi:flagellar FliL protein|nr:flagellar basal body-associated FliL family protein [bacterium]